jgi:hypothetical protein
MQQIRMLLRDPSPAPGCLAESFSFSWRCFEGRTTSQAHNGTPEAEGGLELLTYVHCEQTYFPEFIGDKFPISQE